MKIVTISDTHGHNIRSLNIPECDLLIHAGDLTARGSIDSIKQAVRQLRDTPARFVVAILGNHDGDMRRDTYPEIVKVFTNEKVILLNDEWITINSKKIYGTSWLPNLSGTCEHSWETYDLKEKTDLIPLDTNILITHTGVYGILDAAWRNYVYYGDDKLVYPPDNVEVFSVEHIGNPHLSNKISFTSFSPELIVSGHVHEAYGQIRKRNTIFVNAALSGRLNHQIKNKPIEINLD